MILIDGDILLYNAIHATTINVCFEDEWVGPWLDLIQAKARVDKQIRQLKTRLDDEGVIVCFSDNESCWRTDVYPAYKHSRTGKKPGGWYEMEAYVDAIHKTARMPTMEADDVLGILATRDATDTIIVSDDKDLRTIPGKLYRVRDDKLLTITRRSADLYHLRQTLEGDRVDDYPGCPTVGVKTAEKILLQFANRPRWDTKARKDAWTAVVETYESKGLSQEDALVQAQIARICRNSEYNPKKKSVTLWQPGR